MSQPRKLKILSVVTLVTPMGEYGGPVRVAVNQAKELRSLGHDVTIAGGARGYPDGFPTDLEGVPAVLRPAITVVPGTRFAGLASPGLRTWMRQHLNEYDVVHVHVARDLITLPAARMASRRGVPYVLQPHGMIDRSSNPLATPLDAAMTKKVLRQARHILYLTETEKVRLVEVAGEGLDLVHLPNGVPVPDGGTDPDASTVLYLARVAPRKRPQFFVEMALRLKEAHPEATFVMVGPDEGEGPAVRQAIAYAKSQGVSISWKGPVAPEATVEEMRKASIYVLPSVDEPNGMSVLEAMSIGLPVIITDTCGLAGEVRTSGGGIVVDDSIEELTDAVGTLLSDPAAASTMGALGRSYVHEHLSMLSIAHQLESLYVE